MRSLLLTTFLMGMYLLSCSTLYGQGDLCGTAIRINNPVNYCSSTGEFSTENLTVGNYDPSICFTGKNQDIWFVFTAAATNITITIRGATSISAGGSMVAPQATLYSGVCGGTLSLLECEDDENNDNLLELRESGLLLGKRYLLRVQSGTRTGGSFQICFTNFNPPVSPGSDCATASILCDKSTFTIRSVTGAGANTTEMQGARCFFNGTNGLSFESNSTWFKWTCKTSGTLEFSITPLNKIDDIDFVLFELAGGLNSCNNKKVIRCMAAGERKELYPSPCHGPTGLRAGEDDTSEDAGCRGNNNNFIAPAQLVAGKSYALVINNYTSSGNGFQIEWGGTAEFLGPEPDITIIPTDSLRCYTDPLVIKDASTNSTGKIVSWDWYFGENSTPSKASGQGPFTIDYDKAGIKIIQLRVKSDKGCISTFTDTIELECCKVIEAVDIGGDVTLDLGESHQFFPSVSLKGTEYTYQWMPDSTLDCYICPNPIATPIEEEIRYILRVEDEYGCSAIDAATIYVNIVYPIYAPNAFTPNGDGVNDYYTIFSSKGARKIIALEIFNRWGDKVFSRKNIPPGKAIVGWDGKFDDKLAQNGVYTFRAVVEFINDHRETVTGTITILR